MSLTEIFESKSTRSVSSAILDFCGFPEESGGSKLPLISGFLQGTLLCNNNLWLEIEGEIEGTGS